jgi:hypothetical protein
MKRKNIFILSATSFGLIGITAFVLLSIPPSTAYNPFVTSRLVPEINLASPTINMVDFLDDNFNVSAYESLPDDHLFLVGQTLVDNQLYWPKMEKRNYNGGVFWFSGLAVTNMGIHTYVSEGTEVNRFTHVIYLNDNEIYLVGTVRARVKTTLGEYQPIAGHFTDFNIPMGNDIYTYICKTDLNLSQFRILGFLNDVNENGENFTHVRSVTMRSNHILLLAGQTNSHQGLFANISTAETYDFVMEINTEDNNLQRSQAIGFASDTTISVNHVQALHSGDILISGTYQKALSTYQLTFPVGRQQAGFVMRLEMDAWQRLWSLSDATSMMAGVTEAFYLNFIELTNHHLVGLLARKIGNQYTVVIDYIHEQGRRLQRHVILESFDILPITLLKGTTGYWIVGESLVENQLHRDLTFIHLDNMFKYHAKTTLVGSGTELLNGVPEVTYSSQLSLLVKLSVIDGTYAAIPNLQSNQPLVGIYIS